MAKKQPKALKNKKILLVDDDADFTEMNRAVLENHGYTVFAAYNGEEGVKMTREVRPDLIVMDVMMGKLTDGFFATYDIRKNPEIKDTPIIMVSAVNETVPYRFEPDAQYLPVNRFVDKPIKPEQLLKLVEEMLAEKGKGKA
jgi:CheY-like chemotaxis protein